jgi:hypothetical protein
MRTVALNQHSQLFRNLEIYFLILFNCLIFIFGIFLRLEFGMNFDLSEDSYQRWFISAFTLKTGNYQDYLTNRTSFSWLPGYDLFNIIILTLVGIYQLNILKMINILLNFVAILFFINLYSKKIEIFKSPLIKSLIFIFLWLNPFFILISVTALPEMLMLVIFVILLHIFHNSADNKPHFLKIFVFSIVILFSGLIKIEMWLGVLIFMSFLLFFEKNLIKKDFNKIYMSLAFLSVFFGILWFVVVNFNPSFPIEIINTTSRDLLDTQYQPFTFSIDRLVQFFSFFLTAAPYLIFGIINLFNKPWERLSGWISGIFLMFFTIFLLFGLGTLSFRYFTLVIPFLLLETILFVYRIFNLIKNYFFKSIGLQTQIYTIIKRYGAVFGLILLVGSTISTIDVAEKVSILNEPGKRAGLFLKELPINSSKLILSDSAQAIYYSELNPEYFIGSVTYLNLLNKDIIIEDLINNIKNSLQYMVIVNSTKYFPILNYFPELGLGISNNNFNLLYNATDWEDIYGGQNIFIYEILE